LIKIVTPLVAVSIGSIALNEKLMPQTFFGGSLVLAAIGMIVFRRQSKTVRQDVQIADL